MKMLTIQLRKMSLLVCFFCITSYEIHAINNNLLMGVVTALLGSQAGIDARTLHIRNNADIEVRISVNGILHTVGPKKPTRFDKVTTPTSVYASPTDASGVQSGSPTNRAIKDHSNFNVDLVLCDGYCKGHSGYVVKLNWSRVENPSLAPTMAPSNNTEYNALTQEQWIALQNEAPKKNEVTAGNLRRRK